LGQAVILLPKEAAWQSFLDGLHSFTGDFLEGGREPEVSTEREAL